MAYQPPSALSFDFAAATSGTLSFEFNPVNTTQTISGTGTDVAVYGTTQVANVAKGITAVGNSFSVYGSPFVVIPGAQQTTVPVGINAPPAGTPVLVNTIKASFAVPLPDNVDGDKLHFQFTQALAQQQVYPRGYLATQFGASTIAPSPYVYPVGTDMSRYGTTTVTNASDLVQYVTPSGFVATEYGPYHAVGRALRYKFNALSYTPPTPLIEFDFVDQGGTKTVYADGFAPTEIGVPGVRKQYELVAPSGIKQDAYGSPTVLANQTFAPVGFSTQALGSPTLYNLRQYLQPSGNSFGEVGTPTFTKADPQSITEVGGAYTGATGTAFVSLFERFLENVGGISGSALGAPTVRSNYVYPYGYTPYESSWQRFGSAQVDFGVRSLDLIGNGIDPGGVGDLDIRRNEVFVSPRSFDSLTFGGFDVVYRWKFIGPVTLHDTSDYGTTRVQLGTRYIAPYISEIDASAYGSVSDRLDVANRNRTVSPSGFVSSKFGRVGPSVYNNARLVGPKSVEALEFGSSTVSHGVRTVAAEGLDSFYSSRWHVVYNAAYLLGATGVPPSGFGTARVWINTQWVRQYDTGDQSQYGQPWVSPGVRYIDVGLPGSVYGGGIPPGTVSDLALISRNPQRVSARGIDGLHFGVAYLYERFNLIRARPWDSFFAGRASVTSTTREIQTLGPDLPPLGKPYVGYFLRTIDVADEGIAFPPLAFPPQAWQILVAFRTRKIPLQGIAPPPIPRIHKVQCPGPEVPTDQFILPEGFNYDPQYPNIGIPKFRKHPSPEGWDSLAFGNTFVRVQGFKPLWDFPDSVFGLPSLNPPRYLANVTMGDTISGHGFHRIDPHTIYCTSDITLQAASNHPARSWHDIDSSLPGRNGADVQWGRPFVTTPSTQIIYHTHVGGYFPDESTGDFVGANTVVELKIRTIYMSGSKFTKFGFATFPYLQEIFVNSTVSQAFGDTVVKRGKLLPFTVTVSPGGLSTGAFGTTFIELFNREVGTAGFSMETFGNNFPMIYHYPRGPKETGGTETTLWGATTIDFAIRYVYPVGFESLDTDYEIMHFNERLKVYKLTNPLFPTGVSQTQIGTPGIRLAVQVITPYMIEAPRCLGHDVSVTT